MKYKVGDKVRILSGGADCPDCLVDKVGKIVYIYNLTGRFKLIDNNEYYMCRIAPKYVKPYFEIGQQLLFSFMEEEWV